MDTNYSEPWSGCYAGCYGYQILCSQVDKTFLSPGVVARKVAMDIKFCALKWLL